MAKSARYYYDADAVREEGPTYKRKASGYQSVEYLAAHPDGKQGAFSRRDVVTHGRNRRSVWTVTTKPFRGAHFAVFPPDLIEPCVKAGSAVGDLVLDPFMGSGTTALVAYGLGRDYLGIELNPDYVEMANGRLQELPLRMQWSTNAGAMPSERR